MLPILLAVTEAAHESGGIVEQFGLEPKYVVMQVISFLILFGVLYFFGIKPTIATMEERNNKIAAGLKHAEETAARLAAAQTESAAIIKAAQLDAQKAIDEARKAAKEFGDKQQAEAVTRAADVLTKAQQAIELEHKKMLDQARGEIARLAAAQTESAAIIKAAQLDAQKSIEEARKAAKEFGDKQQAEAVTRAADMLAKAQQAIELEHKKMLDQARGEIARLVVKTTEQVLAKKLSDADRAAYNDAASKELASL